MKNQAGFSLFEILIAVFLGALITSIVLSTQVSTRDELNEAMDDLERAIRFGESEAIMGQGLIRLRLLPPNEERESWAYVLERGSSSHFILPNYQKLEELSGLEREERQNQLKKEVDSSFTPLSEFQSGEKILKGIEVIGAQGPFFSFTTREFEFPLYLYPSGERDHALIVFASDEQMASLEIHPFTDKLERNYHPYSEDFDETSPEAKTLAAKKIFDSWVKKRQ